MNVEKKSENDRERKSQESKQKEKKNKKKKEKREHKQRNEGKRIEIYDKKRYLNSREGPNIIDIEI